MNIFFAASTIPLFATPVYLWNREKTAQKKNEARNRRRIEITNGE